MLNRSDVNVYLAGFARRKIRCFTKNVRVPPLLLMLLKPAHINYASQIVFTNHIYSIKNPKKEGKR